MRQLSSLEKKTLRGALYSPVIRVGRERHSCEGRRFLAHKKTVDSLVRAGLLIHDEQGWYQYKLSQEGRDLAGMLERGSLV